jgi:hypothetical protein
LTVDAAKTTLTLAPVSPADSGTVNLFLNVKLANYPLVPSITKAFKVTITCQVMSLAISPNPFINMFVEPGVTIQPVAQ